jgi:hypothetical protein
MAGQILDKFNKWYIIETEPENNLIQSDNNQLEGAG